MFVAHPAFDPAVITRSSVPAAALCRWVRATDQYHRAKKVWGVKCVWRVDPRQATLMQCPFEMPDLLTPRPGPLLDPCLPHSSPLQMVDPQAYRTRGGHPRAEAAPLPLSHIFPLPPLQMVDPKRIALEGATEELSLQGIRLAEARERLDTIQDTMEELEHR